MNAVWTYIRDYFGVDWIGAFMVSLASAAVVALMFAVFWFVVRRVLQTVVRRTKIDRTAQEFVLSSARYTVGAIATIAVLSEVGVDLTSMVASLGIAGLTLGFAARDTLSNVIAGVFIFWDRPFVIGDLVEVDGYYGEVQVITMRSTRIVTPDGKMLAIPNTTVVNSTVTSYTNFPNLRLDIEFTVGCGEDPKRVRSALEPLWLGDERFLMTPAPAVVLKSLNDYNNTFEVRIWAKDEKGHIPTRFELRERLYELLNEAGIEMPFETLQLAPHVVITQHDATQRAA